MTEQQLLLVTKEMTIAEMVKQYPSTAEVVTKYGVHCVGCHVSPYETLEQGLKSHGYDEAKVNVIIEEVNQSIQDRHLEHHSFLTVSEVAAKKVIEMAKKQGMNEFYLRAAMKKGGCAGFTSSLDFVEEKNTEDNVIEAHGIKILIDPESQPYLDGAVIEYVETLNSTGFKIMNPSAKRSCACGTSFAV